MAWEVSPRRIVIENERPNGFLADRNVCPAAWVVRFTHPTLLLHAIPNRRGLKSRDIFFAKLRRVSGSGKRLLMVSSAVNR